MYGYISLLFFSIFSKADIFCNFLFVSHDNIALIKGSALKGKNLLLREKGAKGAPKGANSFH